MVCMPVVRAMGIELVSPALTRRRLRNNRVSRLVWHAPFHTPNSSEKVNPMARKKATNEATSTVPVHGLGIGIDTARSGSAF
jgi:hypothetical protein